MRALAQTLTPLSNAVGRRRAGVWAIAGLALAVIGACAGEQDRARSQAQAQGEARSIAQAPPPAPEGPDFVPADRGWSLIWSDEFDGAALDRSKWAPEESCWGGGNEELQCYTDREANIQVQNGVLRLLARPERWTGPSLPAERRASRPQTRTQPYTSGKIRTRGLASWTYGRFSARMRLPRGQGAWPAFWMMPAEDHYGPWPLSGEIDILEAVNLGAACAECGEGQGENRIQGALHFGGQWPENTFLVERTRLPSGAHPSDGYHVYTVEWGEGRIDWYVDDLLYFSVSAEDWHTASGRAAGNSVAPFDRPFYLMLNLAVGGRLSVENNAGGVDHGAFPAELLVDWVRVYRCEPDPERALACMSGQ